jgi:hypothetical protein
MANIYDCLVAGAAIIIQGVMFLPGKDRREWNVSHHPIHAGVSSTALPTTHMQWII